MKQGYLLFFNTIFFCNWNEFVCFYFSKDEVVLFFRSDMCLFAPTGEKTNLNTGHISKFLIDIATRYFTISRLNWLQERQNHPKLILKKSLIPL